MKSLLKKIAYLVIPSWSPRLHSVKSRAVYRAIAPRSGYYSQYGQDQFLDDEVFCGQTDGIFIDVGANDGVSFSNTLFFERVRGWRGLCIEPHPRAFDLLVQNRTCSCFNGTMGPVAGVAKFLQLDGYCEMLSGLIDEYSEDHLARVERDLAVHGGQKTVVEIGVEPFSELMLRFDIDEVSFLKVDTEGSEIAVLEEVFRNKVSVKVVSVENTYHSPAIYRLLRSHGFRLIARIGDDEIYRHESFH